MFFIVLVLFIVCIGMPLVYSWRVARLNLPTKAAWLIHVADSFVIVALVFLVGRWDMAGYHVRFILIAVFLGAVLWSLRRHFSRPWLVGQQGAIRQHWTTVGSLALFGGALCYVVYGLVPPPDAREVAFPLDDGSFMIGQGGGISLLNHHSSHREQRYAVDISRINSFGYRAAGLAPKELDRYHIYGTIVVSPCTGDVIGTQNELPDLIPPQTDADNPSGNHVIVDCGDVHVVLAHLQHGSVRVAAGASVSAGDPIGKVGNSGNTTEPHLHIHAVDPKTDDGVPM
jgi:hypothetical protein